MTDSKPVIAVVGPGAVGGLVAWFLHRGGANVVVVGRPASVERITARGLHVSSTLFGEATENVPASQTVPHGASVILAVKTFGLADTLPLIAQSQPREVLSVMNGVGHTEVLAQHLAGIPVASGSISVEATRTADGSIEHKSPFVRIAVPSSAEDFASAQALADTEAELTVQGTDAEVLWSKFRFLAPMALLTSYWQTTLGEALTKDPKLTEALLTEVVACEIANGVADTVEALTRTLGSLPATMHSSLQNDLAAGRISELDSIGGELLRQAQRHGLQTPTIETIVADLTAR